MWEARHSGTHCSIGIRDTQAGRSWQGPGYTVRHQKTKGTKMHTQTHTHTHTYSVWSITGAVGHVRVLRDESGSGQTS